MAMTVDFKTFRDWTKTAFIDLLDKDYKARFVEKFDAEHWKLIRGKLAAYYCLLIDTTDDFTDLALTLRAILLGTRFGFDLEVIRSFKTEEKHKHLELQFLDLLTNLRMDIETIYRLELASLQKSIDEIKQAINASPGFDLQSSRYKADLDAFEKQVVELKSQHDNLNKKNDEIERTITEKFAKIDSLEELVDNKVKVVAGDVFSNEKVGRDYDLICCHPTNGDGLTQAKLLFKAYWQGNEQFAKAFKKVKVRNTRQGSLLIGEVGYEQIAPIECPAGWFVDTRLKNEFEWYTAQLIDFGYEGYYGDEKNLQCLFMKKLDLNKKETVGKSRGSL